MPDDPNKHIRLKTPKSPPSNDNGPLYINNITKPPERGSVLNIIDNIGDVPADHAEPTPALSGANNNIAGPKAGSDYPETSAAVPPGKPENQTSHSGILVVTDLPDKLPVLDAEIALLQSHLSDLIIGVVANDNDDPSN